MWRTIGRERERGRKKSMSAKEKKKICGFFSSSLWSAVKTRQFDIISSCDLFLFFFSSPSSCHYSIPPHTYRSILTFLSEVTRRSLFLVPIISTQSTSAGVSIASCNRRHQSGKSIERIRFEYSIESDGSRAERFTSGSKRASAICILDCLPRIPRLGAKEKKKFLSLVKVAPEQW